MLNKILKYFSIILFLISCLPVHGQTHNGGLDPVYISKTYYNSTVKILLYDSAVPKKNTEQAYLGRGSGFFVSDDGYIFTNRHVVDFCSGYCRYTTFNKEEKKEEDNIGIYSPLMLNDPTILKISYIGRASVIVQVYTNSSGSSYKLYYAKPVVLDTSNFDGAILKVVSDLNGNPVTEKFHPVPLGNSDSVQQGQDLCLYGFPAQVLGNLNVMLADLSTLIFGKNSGLDYNINTQYGLIKTDAVINSGNSGGPVFGPANNVIGIATAAFNMTNIGLIGGIDAMYDLVRFVPGLSDKLVSQGFGPPQHKPQNSTVVYYKIPKLPSTRSLGKLNGAYASNKLSNSFIFSLGFLFGMPHTEVHSIEDFQGTTPSGYPSTNTHGGGNFNIPTSALGGSFSFTSPSIIKNSKNMLSASIRWDYFRTTMNWNIPVFYTTPYPTTFQMNSTVRTSGFGIYITANYAYSLSSGLTLGIYAGAGMYAADITDIPIGVATSYGQTASITYNTDKTPFPFIAGLNARYKYFFVDLAYSHFVEKINYILPYDYFQGLFYSDYFVSGTIQRNPLYVTIGISYCFYGKKR